MSLIIPLSIETLLSQTGDFALATRHLITFLNSVRIEKCCWRQAWREGVSQAGYVF